MAHLAAPSTVSVWDSRKGSWELHPKLPDLQPGKATTVASLLQKAGARAGTLVARQEDGLSFTELASTSDTESSGVDYFVISSSEWVMGRIALMCGESNPPQLRQQ